MGPFWTLPHWSLKITVRCKSPSSGLIKSCRQTTMLRLTRSKVQWVSRTRVRDVSYIKINFHILVSIINFHLPELIFGRFSLSFVGKIGPFFAFTEFELFQLLLWAWVSKRVVWMMSLIEFDGAKEQSAFFRPEKRVGESSRFSEAFWIRALILCILIRF